MSEVELIERAAEAVAKRHTLRGEASPHVSLLNSHASHAEVVLIDPEGDTVAVYRIERKRDRIRLKWRDPSH